MSGGGTDGEPATAKAGGDAGTVEAADGDAKKVEVPWVSWVSLAMLLLVYISNQWTRSLVYCESVCVCAAFAFNIDVAIDSVRGSVADHLSTLQVSASCVQQERCPLDV